MADQAAFIAYPGKPTQIGDCIRIAVESLNRRQNIIGYTTWEENDVAGRPLVAPIFTNIDNSCLLVADVTKLNFNVTYEIGYSIGRSRRVFLVRNIAVESDDDIARLVGVFDTLGYENYENSDQLAELLSDQIDLRPLSTAASLDRKAPTYILETPRRSEAMVRMVGCVKKARLQYRSFAPSEDTRLAASDAVAQVSSSYGVLVPMLGPTETDANIHNMRAAFIAGLSHGMDKTTLILQARDGSVPLDLRDFAKTYGHPDDITEYIHAFALDVYEEIQRAEQIELPERDYLAGLFVGDPMAENEFQTLGQYYLPTDEFRRALRGEVNLVVGRKGTGKTALFAQVRDRLRPNRLNIVVDLKPEGYQLIKLKEEVLDYLSEGAKAHLITAFWEYLLLMEVCYKVLEKDKTRYLREPKLYEKYLELKELYDKDESARDGDFSERLLSLAHSLTHSYRDYKGSDTDVKLTSDEVTNFLYKTDLKELRDHLSEYLNYKGATWVLFDNLDKGWTSVGLAGGDIVILRCLIDAARKIQRHMQGCGHVFHSIVFVRNDVYQLLMEQTPDFGKDMRASLDWSDPDRLREMMRRRLINHDIPEDANFQTLWGRVCVTHYRGEESSQYLIDRSLMRPRNFLKLFSHCRGSAVNLSHEQIEDNDLEKGLKNYSNDIIVDADQELTDIEPSANGLIYQFIGEGSQFTREDISVFMEANKIENEKWDRVIEFLLYYGIFGISNSGENPQYIYDVGYDLKIFRTIMAKFEGVVSFTLNPAFWPGLGIKPS